MSMDNACSTCFFYDEPNCRDSITGIPVKEVSPDDTCEDYEPCQGDD